MEHLTRWDVFIAALGATAPLLGVLLTLHLQNRSDKRKSDQRLDTLLLEYPLHDHTERDCEPLLASGIRFPRSTGRSGNR